MVLFYKCCFCCLEIYIYAITKISYTTLWIQNFEKRCSCTYYSKSLHITNSVRRIAYFCDGRVKKNMLLRVNRRKSCKKLLIYCFFVVSLYFFFLLFSLSLCWKNGIPTPTDTTLAVNSCKHHFASVIPANLKRKQTQHWSFCVTVEITFQ